MRKRFLEIRDWLAGHWVVGAGFMAAALLALAPLLFQTLSLPLLMIFLHSPAYMIHQVEEHAGDRFRAFANGRIFGGREGLTTNAVLVINLAVVWGMNLAAFYAAFLISPGFGLIAPYAMLVNAFTHLGARVNFGSYNPGVVSAAVLFVPLSSSTILVINRLPDVGAADNIVAIAGAFLLHALIILNVKRRLRALRGAAALTP